MGLDVRTRTARHFLKVFGTFFSDIMALKSLVTTGTIAGLAALKCSDVRPYSSRDFPLFSLSIAEPTSASEMQTSVSDSSRHFVSVSSQRKLQSSRNTLS